MSRNGSVIFHSAAGIHANAVVGLTNDRVVIVHITCAAGDIHAIVMSRNGTVIVHAAAGTHENTIAVCTSDRAVIEHGAGAAINAHAISASRNDSTSQVIHATAGREVNAICVATDRGGIVCQIPRVGGAGDGVDSAGAVINGNARIYGHGIGGRAEKRIQIGASGGIRANHALGATHSSGGDAKDRAAGTQLNAVGNAAVDRAGIDHVACAAADLHAIKGTVNGTVIVIIVHAAALVQRNTFLAQRLQGVGYQQRQQ